MDFPKPDNGDPPDARLQEILGHGNAAGRLSRYRVWLILALVVVAVTAAYLYVNHQDSAKQPRYKSEAAVAGNLVVKVSATGNLKPTNQVDVGSELSGIVDTVFVDENDQVTKGQELARLDLSKLQDAVARSRANLAASEAQVLQAQATATEAQDNLARLRQMAKLSGGKVPSPSELDSAEASAKRGKANEASAQASVVQARAALQSDETNLKKAQIRSPINGVVLTRQVEPGQTVAASFQAPVLFQLAEDLAKMELQVDVDEADVGEVQVGQKATFTVDAWPGRRYDAVISRVGYGSQVKDGVVSYPAVLQVDNTDLSLRPGMTATAEIITLVHENVLLAPNAALRFTPPVTGPTASNSRGGLLSALMPRRPRHNQKQPQVTVQDTTDQRRLWILRDGQPVPVDVKTGPSNGHVTEIISGDIRPGMEVITEVVNGSP